MDFKVGDKIIEFGQVYRVFKITERESFDGDGKEKIVHFKPHYTNIQNKTMIYSIPIRNIKNTYIRKPLTKTEVMELLTEWVKKPNIQTPSDKNHATEILNKNNPKKTIRLLKCLWIEKKDDSTNYTKSKRDMFEMAMKRFVEEVAFVLDLSIEEAQDKITESLKKHSVGEKVVEA